jgi:hypothetical protein
MTLIILEWNNHIVAQFPWFHGIICVVYEWNFMNSVFPAPSCFLLLCQTMLYLLIGTTRVSLSPCSQCPGCGAAVMFCYVCLGGTWECMKDVSGRFMDIYLLGVQVPHKCHHLPVHCAGGAG